MSAADVVVVGAGVIGASCAYHLARAGLRVIVLDRAAGPDGGSTARATGGFRAQFATPIDIRLSLLARDRLRAFRDETGVDPAFDPVGYLWLASSAAELAALRAANELHHREGLTEARLVDLDELRELQPAAALDGITGGAWCPTDGVMRPTEIQRGYLEAAARLGAEIRWSEEVVALERGRAGGGTRAGDGGRAGDPIVAVVTQRGRYATGLVVDAAGPWAAALAALAGVTLPVVPLRRQVAVTVPTSALPARMPLTIWVGDGFHARVRDGRVLLLRPSPGDPADPWSTAVEGGWLDDIAALAATRLPALRDVPLDRPSAWAGLYEMSPDRSALLGFAAPCPNLLLVNGSSGHGVMHAPALGLLTAQLATSHTPLSLDIHPLRPSRFDDEEFLSQPGGPRIYL